ncbi:hypothetical protein ACIBBB_35620 [Streptomyces sp. NPDC051217]|uniref:hypothetical protein n=1 Tax=Streptomyces sp. NPDC051217 TaxID=3365644 RepID=UPI0037A22201
MATVARAIAWIKRVSSLNRHFGSVTAMSPLQFQKQLPLFRASPSQDAARLQTAAIVQE